MANEILVSTKLNPPRLRRPIRRTRLLHELRSDEARRLVLVSAPPGAGKTSLLADWVAADRDRRSFAWLSLDRLDNDPVRFWTYVLEAVGRVSPGEQANPPVALARSRGDLVELVIPTLVNRLAVRRRPIVLALDDYHLITSGDIHTGVDLLVERLPLRCQLVLASRADPPLGLARLRARGELLEIRAADLMFSPEEAAVLLRDVVGRELERREVLALQRRTEGWAVGLGLAALSLRGRADRAAFIDAFA